MTTTDDAAERLARLRARRSGTDTAEPPSTTADPVVSPPRRRRSPALSAKVMTVGASTTAVLGMMAGYGIAEGRAEPAPTLEPVDEAAGADTAPPTTAVPTTLAASTAVPPQVVVVVVDGRTGEPIDPAALAQAAVDGDLATAATSRAPSATSGAPSGTSGTTSVTTTSPTAAPTEATVDTAPTPVAVAVDVPTPEPAPAPAPAPAPRPEASSGGS